MPIVRATGFNDTNLRRMATGAISETHSGTSKEAIPIAVPAITHPERSAVLLGANAARQKNRR